MLDPHLSGSKIDRQVYHNLYEPLLVLDDKLGIQPNLAESWQTPDPKTLIFKLRQGVKFHDGTDFNAEAAQVQLRPHGQRSEVGAQGRGRQHRLGRSGRSADAQDQPQAARRVAAGHPDRSRRHDDLAGGADRSSAPTCSTTPPGAGTGPFQFVEWVQDDHLLLKRNDAYWNKDGGPYLDQLRYRPIPDDTVKLQSLQGGEIDVMDYLAPRDGADCQGRHQPGR